MPLTSCTSSSGGSKRLPASTGTHTHDLQTHSTLTHIQINIFKYAKYSVQMRFVANVNWSREACEVGEGLGSDRMWELMTQDRWGACLPTPAFISTVGQRWNEMGLYPHALGSRRSHHHSLLSMGKSIESCQKQGCSFQINTEGFFISNVGNSYLILIVIQ